MKIVSIEEIQHRISTKFPEQPFEIVEYTKVSKPFVIKCLKCGRILTYSSFNNYINAKRKGVCPCYNAANNINRHESCLLQVQAIIDNNKDIEFIEYWHKAETKKNMIRVKCLVCNQIYSKPIAEFIKNKNCPFCVGRELLNTQAVKATLPKEYELLTEYKTTNENVYIRHSCGFVWKTKAKKLYDYIGCPHCNKKRSKGEQKIEQWLLNNDHQFEIEKTFDWQSNTKRRYDFYIPEYKLIIEYNGEQHYIENKYFKTPLQEQQEIDKIKKSEAEKEGYNYLIIGYFDFNNIDTILTNWFNDYSVRKQA